MIKDSMREEIGLPVPCMQSWRNNWNDASYTWTRNKPNGSEESKILVLGKVPGELRTDQTDEIRVSAYGEKTNEGQTRRLSVVTKGDQILRCNVWYAGGACSL